MSPKSINGQQVSKYGKKRFQRQYVYPVFRCPPIYNFGDCLRREAARTLKKFAVAIKAAFTSVKLSDLENWYRHCGYQAQ